MKQYLIRTCIDCNEQFKIDTDSKQTRCMICWIVYLGLDDRVGAKATLGIR